ncbi:uncharacterized protein LOC144159168 isoform X3 [Haemaphysalis longicornis]
MMGGCNRVLAQCIILLFLMTAVAQKLGMQKLASLENVGAPQDKVVDALATMSRKVTGLNATPLGATSVRVEWRAPAEDAIGYNVRAVSLNAHNLEINTSDTSIVVHGLVPESQYVLSVSPFIVENGIVMAGSPANSTVTTGVVRAPTRVKLRATCNQYIRASWKYIGEELDGFEVTLKENASNISERITLSGVERRVAFKIDPTRRNFTFTIRSYVYEQNHRHRSDVVERTVKSFGQAPQVGGFEAHVLTATSAKVTWKTVHSEDIYISVCPAGHPEEDCLQYANDGDLLVYEIRGLKPSTRYTVHARFSVSMDGRVCKHKGSSQTITTPAQAPPSLQARVLSVTETTATVVVDRLLSEQEFLRVSVSGKDLIYRDRIFTLWVLVPAQKYMLQIAVCVPIMTCSARTELEVMTPAASPSPNIEIVEVGDSSIAIKWTFTEAVNQTTASYRVGYSSLHESLADVTSDLFYQFTSLDPNSTYDIYVEALSTEDGGSSIIGSPSFVTVTTETERPQSTDTRINPVAPALSSEEGRVKHVVQSFVTSSGKPGTTEQQSSGRSARPAFIVLSLSTALLCNIQT